MLAIVVTMQSRSTRRDGWLLALGFLKKTGTHYILQTWRRFEGLAPRLEGMAPASEAVARHHAKRSIAGTI